MNQVSGELLLLTVNTGVPAEQAAVTWVSGEASLSPPLKVTWTSPESDLSSSTRQPLSGWAIRRVRSAPMQRTETCPPTTVTVRSLTGVEVTEPVSVLACEGDCDGDGAPLEVFGAVGFGVVDAEGFVVGPVPDAP